MKPTMQTIEGEKNERASDQRFPVTDFNFQSIALGGCSGPCVKMKGPSFHSISSAYFKGEACNYFLAEAFVFAVILATTALPLFNGAHAILDLIRTTGGV
jgi:hypothetical protein